jgi:hypothetical protein
MCFFATNCSIANPPYRWEMVIVGIAVLVEAKGQWLSTATLTSVCYLTVQVSTPFGARGGRARADYWEEGLILVECPIG